MATPNPTQNELLQTLKQAKSEKNYDAMLAAAQQAVSAFPNENKFWDHLHFAQAHYVNAKLESEVVKQLEEKKDYNALASVYLKLLTIFPESKQLIKLLKKTREKIQEAHKNELKAYYTNAQNQIEGFMKEKNFEHAVEACHEILDSEPGNKPFIKLLVRAEDGLDEQMNQALELYFKEALPTLKAEYTQNKDQFVRI